MQPTEVLQKYFGYREFRPGQEKVVQALLNGQDVLAVMPTGAGKSICFQVPALLLPGITLVVSPLISLMQDQVRELVEAGIPAAYFNSALNDRQYAHALRNAAAGQYRIIYVAPERLQTARFQQFVQQVEISLVAVDEAHCVSQWGQDFRPGYLQVAPFVTALAARPPIAAFTATATAVVKEDIVQMLQMRQPKTIVTGFDRENLFYEVRRPKDKKEDLLALLSRFPGESGIIYCSTRKAVEDVAAFLNAQGYPAACYHAGLPQGKRRQNQEDFLYDRVPLMVATNAFGMGIDKSNVRFVIHFNMPKDVESYYQEAGRAGRDGTPAQCILLYSGQDVRTNQFLITHGKEQTDLEESVREALLQKDLERLRQMTFYCTTKQCLRHFLLQYFGEDSPRRCEACGNCSAPSRDVDITADAREILRCVQDTGERFGAGLITDVLLGVDSERITQRNLNRIPSFGALSRLPMRAVRERLQALLEAGYLLRSTGEYPVLSLDPSAEQLLHGQNTLQMRERLGTVKTEGPAPKHAEKPEHPELYRRLRELRKTIAAKQSVPAFVVLTDATLHAMCRELPQTEQEMLQISGIGEKKLQRYGRPFLECIQAYVQSMNKPF